MKNPFNLVSVFFGNFFNNMGGFFNLGFSSRLLKNPLGLFVYGILSKWYISVVIAGLVVTFWVFKGLSDRGIIKAAEEVVFTALNETKSVAKNCMPKILEFRDFWNCLENPPPYEATEMEKNIERALQKELDPSKFPGAGLSDSPDSDNNNPYDQ